MSDDGYVTAEEGDVLVEVATARILRRWAKANGKHRKVRVTVPDARREHDPGVQMIGGKLTNTVTGEVYERRLTMTKGPFVGRGAGFVLVNDGVRFAEQLHAALEGRPHSPGTLVEANARAVEVVAARRRAEDEYAAALGIVRMAA